MHLQEELNYMDPVEEEGEDLGDSDISDDDYLMGYGEEDPDDYYHMDNMDQDYQNQVRWESLLLSVRSIRIWHHTL